VRAFASILLLAFAPACSRSDDVFVRVSRAESLGRTRVENLQVIVGASKSSWPDLAPGKAVSVVLNPEGETAVGALAFGFDGEPANLRGPELARGMGHALEVAIDEAGTVTERHCERPCEL